MDDLKTRITTMQCEFEIQFEIAARLAQELNHLFAQLEAAEKRDAFESRIALSP